MKYSDLICQWLKDLGYTHCFFVAGGNIMHMLESASHYFTCIPVIHEISAGIAAEYMTEAGGKAFALVTAGPGVTNITTAIAGAWLESHELLVIGGQVKTSDLSRDQVRQRGIQEINGAVIVSHICKGSWRVETPDFKEENFKTIVTEASKPRKGPVFMEIPIDIQGAQIAVH